LLAFALGARADAPLVLIANRDELFARPTAPMQVWDGGEGIVAGIDRERGGTWLGVRTRPGERPRFAAVTNVRDPIDLRPKEPGEPSRGDLVSGFLRSETDALAYASRAAADARMRGFNLLVLDEGALVWCSNRAPAPGLPRRVTRGVHGLSNAFLDTPWPKVERAKAMLAAELAKKETPSLEALFSILADDARPADAALPDTGVGLALERELSPIRITTPVYGTRCATVLVARADGTATIAERTIAPHPGGEVRFELRDFAISPRVWTR
jgi:uncharacterized protein with NRDE domain